jgi:chromosome partitioning protein
MAVITFANTKGGAGKTTAVLLLATELARKGYRITILDADPQHWISHWHDSFRAGGEYLGHRFRDLASLPHAYLRQQAQDRLFHHRSAGRAQSDAGHRDRAFGSCADSRSRAAPWMPGGAQVLELLQYLDEKAGIKINHSVVSRASTRW